MNGVILEAQDLKFFRGRREVIDVHYFCVREKEIVALIGPNGAGKSTLLQIMALLLNPARGEVRFRGITANKKNRLSFRRNMGMVFQEPLLLNTTVRNNVAAGLKMRGADKVQIKKKVDYWLERLGISHLAGRQAVRLSGGEARRVSLARALALEPEILFLDEPFSSLDLPSRLSMLNELGGLLRDTGVCAVFVTHDFYEIPYLTNQVAVLNEGRLVKTGAFEDVFGLKPRKETFLSSLYKIF